MREKKQIILGDFSIIRETEKAYLLKFKGVSKDAFGGLFYSKEDEEFWAPKSAIKRLGDGYVVARWWKLRDGDPALDSTRWPGLRVVLWLPSSTPRYEELIGLKDWEVRVFQIAWAKELGSVEIEEGKASFRFSDEEAEQVVSALLK